MTSDVFGTLPDGCEVVVVTLAAHGLTARIISLGASLQDLRLQDVPHALVLGFPELAPYLAEGQYFGAIVGRYANRIGHARARIMGCEFSFDRNQNDRHILHGGSDGTGTRNWHVADCGADSVTLTDTLPDGHMGFPGELQVSATYRILPGPELQLTIRATTDAPTLCNFAQHSYFNLDGQADVADHDLVVHAARWLPVDADLIPLGDPAPVTDGHMDFRNPTRLGPRLPGPVIDHNLCIADRREPLPREVARLAAGGLRMRVLSTEPGLQVYAGNHLSPAAAGLNGAPYGRNAGIALESQTWPDAPNHADYPPALLQPGDSYCQITTLAFDRIAGC